MEQVHQIPGKETVTIGGGVEVVTTSLYVGDLEYNVTDAQLYDLFTQVGQVASVRVCRDSVTLRSLGYGYVNFVNRLDAENAIKHLNFTPLNRKPIRIMHSHRDPADRKSGAGNIFIKNLDKSIDNKGLQEAFHSFGKILSCKVATDLSGQSKGYGFVQYEDQESAQKAIDKLNGMLLNDKQVYVGPFVRRQERENAIDKTKFTNVYVKNLAESMTDEDLAKRFGQFGKITSAVVMRDAEGKSKCFGFVNFENADDAAKAVDGLNGQKFDDKEWYVGKAQKKAEREAELKQRFEQSIKDAVDKYQGTNLYIKNLDDTIDDDKLKELFSEFGTVSSCKVMRDPSGVSKGSGFVAFSTAEEASRALTEMNNKMILSKPLYVALAQRKEDRRARLQAQFSQMIPVAIPATAAPRMPMYPPGAAQPLYYGQPPAAMLPPQAAFGYQHQLMPGIRGGTPVPNFLMPMVQQGHRPGGRHTGGAPGQQTQQAMPMMQQQMLPRGHYRYPPAHGLPGAPHSGAVPSLQFEIAGMSLHDAALSPTVPVGTLATLLANATPDRQRLLLGENLYPMVEQMEPEMAAKVTGMLLEMDQPEVLHLLESPDALKSKVAEAMDVLRNVVQQPALPNNSADQLAGIID
ncbi:polyadenylate-binding protein 2-like [Silene latifolia]|uniref:polyadenylate-binding protein 2-like n=1 Tax=Silene latifolia TaxID=37657 RepID=UPI003D77C0EB